MNEGFKMNEIEIKQKVVELVDFYNGKFGTNFPYPKVSFYECYKTMGMYYAKEDEVAFNSLAIGSEEFLDTVIHEVAHKFAFHVYPRAKQAHGPEFKSLCRLAGGSGKTKVVLSSIDSSIAEKFNSIKPRKVRRFEYICRCGTFELSTRRHNQVQKGLKLGCPRCMGRIKFVKEL